MPDLDPLPSRPHAPVLAPRTGDFHAVVGRAKSRRRRHLAGAGAGVAGLVAVVALTTGGGAGSFGLDPVQPAGGITAGPDAPGESETPEPSSTPATEPTNDAHPSGDPSPGSDPAAEEPGWRPSTPASEPTYDAGRPPPVRPLVVRTDVANDPAKVCDSDPSQLTAIGWCLRYEGPATVRVGDVHPYRLLACRHVGRGAQTLTFRTEQHVDFTVIGDGREEWHWSGGYPFPARQNTVAVAEGRCAQWTVTWDATDDDGIGLRPGQYSMSPYLMPSDWGDGTSITYGSGYTFEVTE